MMPMENAALYLFWQLQDYATSVFGARATAIMTLSYAVIIGSIFAVVVVQSALKFWNYAFAVLRSIPMLLFFGFVTHTFLSRYWGLVETTFGETWRVAMGQM